MRIDRKKALTLFALTLLITSLLLANMNLGTGQVEPGEPIYLHGPSLTPIHMDSNESLVPIHMNSNMTLTPVHMHYVGPPQVDPIYEPLYTEWHELYPEFCQNWILTSLEDNGDGILSPNDQIYMSDPPGLNVIWYHVDRITWTVLLSNPEFPDDIMYVEYKGSFDPEKDPIRDPVCTYWHEVYPSYSNVYHIVDMEPSGPLEYCTYILLEQYIDGMPTEIYSEWHVEEVVTDLILREKIMDPISTWWHEIYPDYCKWWHLTSWEEDVEDPYSGMLSPSDQIDMIDEETGIKTWYHVDRVTLALNVTLEEEPSEWMKIELKTSYFEEMYNALKYPIETLWHEVYPDYSNVYMLVYWDWFEDDNCNGVLDVCDYIYLWNMSGEIAERYHVEDICYDIILNKKIMDPRCTYWYEVAQAPYALEPPFPLYHLTSWEEDIEDPYPGRLSPGDQIDMDCDAWYWDTFWSMGDVNRDGYIDDTDKQRILDMFGWTGPPGGVPEDINSDGAVDMEDATIWNSNEGLDIWTTFPGLGKKWYYVDRVTLTMNISIIDYPEWGFYLFEYKGPFEDMYRVKTDPDETLWHIVWPYYEYYPEDELYIYGWEDNCNGVLDRCDNVTIDGTPCHVEGLAIDIILNEKITDPVCTIWRDITYWYDIPPEYWDEYHIVGWEDNDDGLLSYCDRINMSLLPEGPTKEYHVEYVTLTINVTDPYYPEEWTLFEYLYEGPIETMYWVKTHPIGSWWYVPPWPDESGRIEGWIDNCNGVLDYCDYITFDPTGEYWYHVEDVAIDMAVTEAIHDVAVTAVSSKYPVVYQGGIDPISVTVTNYGDFTETVDVYAYYDSTQAAPKQTVVLDPGDTQALTFDWNTAGVSPGVYTISAIAFIPVDDDPTNNQLTDGTQEVKRPPPEFLDVELYPWDVVDLEGEWAVGTQWHELHPEKFNYYKLISWEPGRVLSPEDLVLMNDVTFQVDDVTIDIEVMDLETGNTYWLDYECGYWTFDPEEPICTKWNEIKSEYDGPPEIPRCWHLTGWEDNGDGRLSYCDIIDMTPFPNLDYEPYPGPPVRFHVELVTVTLKSTSTEPNRFVVMIGDAPAHAAPSGPGVLPGYPAHGYGGDPGPDEIMGTGDDLDYVPVINKVASEGISVFTVDYLYAPGSDAYTSFDYIASQTGGIHYNGATTWDVSIANEIATRIGQGRGDVVFIYDITGGMYPYFATMITKTKAIIDALSTLDVRFGVGTHVDYPNYYTSYGYASQYGIPGDYAWSMDTDLTDATTAKSVIQSVVVPGYSGADMPEDYVRALYECQYFSWRAEEEAYLEFMGTLEEFEAMDYIHTPYGTWWHEIWPVQGREWELRGWSDTPFLSPSDQIWLALKDEFGEPIPGTEVEYHVDKLTVAMNITTEGHDWHIVKFEGSLKQFKNYHWYMEFWPGPFGTQWLEVNPDYCRQWYLSDWEDNGDYYLGYDDYIEMIDKETGDWEWFYVESISTDMWLTVKHDVAVTDVTVCCGATILHGGVTAHIPVTVENQGYSTETFGVTAYWNTTAIQTVVVTLPSGASTSRVLNWTTTGLTEYDYYDIWAYAGPVTGEADLSDNKFTYGLVQIVHKGDVNADGKVRVDDILAVALAFGTNCGQPGFNPHADINCDGKIRIDDVLAAALEFGWGP